MKGPTPLEVAASFGLRVEGLRARGSFEGRPVDVRVHAVDANLSVRVAAQITPPLDLGLDVKNRQVSPAAAAEALGDPAIDADLVVHCDERARARALFDEALRAHVLTSNRARLDMRIRDDACIVGSHESLFTLDTRWTEQALRAATKGAGLVEVARAAVPPAQRLTDLATNVARWARANGGHVATTPLWLRADVAGQRLEVVSRRVSGPRYELTATTTFESPLDFGLSLRRHGLADGIRSFFGADATSLDHPIFDRQFVVEADVPKRGRLGVLLPRDVRDALIDVDARFAPVTLDDRRVVVEPIPESTRAATIAELLDRLVWLGARLPRNARGAEPGPYR